MVRRRRFGVVLDAARKVQAAGRRPNKIMSEGVIYMYESGSKFPLKLGAHQAILEKRRKFFGEKRRPYSSPVFQGRLGITASAGVVSPGPEEFRVEVWRGWGWWGCGVRREGSSSLAVGLLVCQGGVEHGVNYGRGLWGQGGWGRSGASRADWG